METFVLQLTKSDQNTIGLLRVVRTLPSDFAQGRLVRGCCLFSATSQGALSFLEMALQAAAYRPRRRVLYGNLFAFFGDLIAAIRNVTDVELQGEASRLTVPQVKPGCQVRR